MTLHTSNRRVVPKVLYPFPLSSFHIVQIAIPSWNCSRVGLEDDRELLVIMRVVVEQGAGVE